MSQLAKKDVEREYKKFVINWLPRFVERSSIFLYNIKNHTDIKEEDWEVIKTGFRMYYMGYCPDFIPVWQPPHLAKKEQQVMLFPEISDTVALEGIESTDGTIIDNTTSETKIEE